MKVKVNDNVLVTTGKNKGKTGKIIRMYKKSEKVVIEKINIRVKHIKKKQNQAGERIQFEAPLAVSNVKIICPHCNKATRVGYTKKENGKKERICKKCKQTLDKEIIKGTKTSKKSS